MSWQNDETTKIKGLLELLVHKGTQLMGFQLRAQGVSPQRIPFHDLGLFRLLLCKGKYLEVTLGSLREKETSYLKQINSAGPRM